MSSLSRARRTFTVPCKWDPDHLDPKIISRIKESCDSWDGTPFMLGQSAKGLGVDCIRFVVGFLCDMYRLDARDYKFPLISTEACYNDPKLADDIFSQLLHHFPSTKVPKNPTDGLFHIQPGDIVCCGPDGGTYGHGMIVGALPCTFYHATSMGVMLSGGDFMNVGVYQFKAFYRPNNRLMWI